MVQRISFKPGIQRRQSHAVGAVADGLVAKFVQIQSENLRIIPIVGIGRVHARVHAPGAGGHDIGAQHEHNRPFVVNILCFIADIGVFRAARGVKKPHHQISRSAVGKKMPQAQDQPIFTAAGQNHGSAGRGPDIRQIPGMGSRGKKPIRVFRQIIRQFQDKSLITFSIDGPVRAAINGNIHIDVFAGDCGPDREIIICMPDMGRNHARVLPSHARTVKSGRAVAHASHMLGGVGRNVRDAEIDAEEIFLAGRESGGSDLVFRHFLPPVCRVIDISLGNDRIVIFEI